MRVTLDNPASAPQPLSPHYSQVARVEQADGSALLFLSADVINIRTYLTDITRLDEYGTVRREFLTGTPPTSMTFEVSRLFRPEALIEVEVTAAAAACR
ncbi:Rid family hydrolase [Streptomyces prunicolor]|uniref:Rid family hydrolase n=1 Tax=Streptomyces prunicolor TaxID=67348 RepID=UPI003719CA2D